MTRSLLIDHWLDWNDQIWCLKALCMKHVLYRLWGADTLSMSKRCSVGKMVMKEWWWNSNRSSRLACIASDSYLGILSKIQSIENSHQYKVTEISYVRRCLEHNKCRRPNQYIQKLCAVQVLPYSYIAFKHVSFAKKSFKLNVAMHKTNCRRSRNKLDTGQNSHKTVILI